MNLTSSRRSRSTRSARLTRQLANSGISENSGNQLSRVCSFRDRGAKSAVPVDSRFHPEGGSVSGQILVEWRHAGGSVFDRDLHVGRYS